MPPGMMKYAGGEDFGITNDYNEITTLLYAFLQVCLSMFGLCFAPRFLALGLLVASRTAPSNLRHSFFFNLRGCGCYL